MQIRIQSQNFSTARAVRFQMLDKVYTYPTHIHQFAELVICLGNSLNVTVNGNTEILHEGQAAFIFPFQPHSYFSKERNQLSLLVFSPSMIPDFFNKVAGKVGASSVFTPKESTLDTFRSRILEKSDFDLFDTKGFLYLTLSDFLENTELCEASADNSIALGVVDYVTKHITDKITLTDMARELGYNPNYLSERIGELFGINLCSLIANIRADKARYLLVETQKTGLEICYECGFGSERSFHRQFKEITGSTPKEYRSKFKVSKINHGIIKYF